jgi:hypothetical protein
VDAGVVGAVVGSVAKAATVARATIAVKNDFILISLSYVGFYHYIYTTP